MLSIAQKIRSGELDIPLDKFVIFYKDGLSGKNKDETWPEDDEPHPIRRQAHVATQRIAANNFLFMFFLLYFFIIFLIYEHYLHICIECTMFL